jgi:glycolate dehydrogenase iron-sulfur subunit
MADSIQSTFDDRDRPSAELIKDCVHCGFCLSACPTYLETGNELDSPRGRIYLMKAALNSEIPMGGSLVEHLDMCLGCLACEPACPSGVQYGSLIEAARSQIERRYDRGAGDKLHRGAIFSLFPYPARLKLMLPFLYLYQKLGISGFLRSSGILGKISPKLEQMEAMLPVVKSPTVSEALPAVIAPKGKKRFRVAMLSGCVQSVFFGDTNAATARVLAENGCEVIVPESQGCCGALSVHSGRLSEGRDFAKTTIEMFDNLDVDALIVNSAGCGSTMKEYGEILKDDPEFSERAEGISNKTKDIMEFLSDIGLRGKLHELKVRVTYQDACHLGHAQRIKSQPRQVMEQIPGLELFEMPESDVCCGSAGIYNLVQPEMSQDLLQRKIKNLMTQNVDYLAAGNPGCLLQIKKGIDKYGLGIKTAHPIELLDWSYRGGRAE